MFNTPRIRCDAPPHSAHPQSYRWITSSNHQSSPCRNLILSPPRSLPHDSQTQTDDTTNHPLTKETHITRRSLALSTATLASSLLIPATPSLAALALPPQSSPSYDSIPSPSSISRHREAKMILRAIALRGSVPRSHVEDFAKALEGYGLVAMTTKPQLADIWDELNGYSNSTDDTKKRKKRGKISPTTADVVSLGDTWLQQAIVNDLIQPIENAKQYRYWNSLSPRWQQLVTRSSTGHLDPTGNVWAIPYRWGCTLVLYRKERSSFFNQNTTREFTDWDDLLHPSLKKKVGMTDNPREFIGIVLKTFGLSFNATAATIQNCGLTVNNILQRARQIAQQVVVFSNTHHVRAFAAGEIDVLIGWSDDILPLAKRSNVHEVCVPLSGTSLWADVWTIPKHAAGGARDGEPSPLLPAWFELGLQPVRVRKAMGLDGGASPLLLPSTSTVQLQKRKSAMCTPVRTELSGSSKLINGVFPSDEVLERSEFLCPLDSETEELYKRILLQLQQQQQQ